MSTDFSSQLPLFRAKSITRAKAPKSLRIIALIVFVITAGCIVLLFSPWQQTSFAVGRVIAYSPNERPQVIAAPVDGRISTWHVYEGSKVEENQSIADIADIDPRIMERLQSELTAATQKINASERALDTSKKNLDRQKQLADQGLSSQRAYELAQLEYAKLLSDLSSATAELARIEVRLSRQSAQQVTAPRQGVVQRILVAQGGAIVKAGDPLALLVPATNDRVVELFVDGNDLPLVSTGRKVRLQFEGWPALQFAGWPSIAKGTFGGKVSVIDTTDDGSGKFRIIVLPDEEEDPWPQPHYLRQGVRVHGWILLDQVSLGYELWRRFNGFPQSISTPPQKDSLLLNLSKPKKKDEKSDDFGGEKK